ncbi:hypothetical protein [Vineibacter terrae]|uniref:hypothetical protein n=1 Tax=Vineibacter terrae TaxID=2586908 RepID=UPI0015B3F889|nr:hypothetical protein [Vineibacter terrae]
MSADTITALVGLALGLLCLLAWALRRIRASRRKHCGSRMCLINGCPRLFRCRGL